MESLALFVESFSSEWAAWEDPIAFVSSSITGNTGSSESFETIEIWLNVYSWARQFQVICRNRNGCAKGGWIALDFYKPFLSLAKDIQNKDNITS